MMRIGMKRYTYGSWIGLLSMLLFSSCKEKTQLEFDTLMFTEGIIDSLNLIDLIGFLEKKYSVKVPPGQLTLQNFDSIDRIVAFLERQKDG